MKRTELTADWLHRAAAIEEGSDGFPGEGGIAHARTVEPIVIKVVPESAAEPSTEQHDLSVGDRVLVTEPHMATYPGGHMGEIVAVNGRELGYAYDILVKADLIPGRGCFSPGQLKRIPTVHAGQLETDTAWVNGLLHRHGIVEVWHDGRLVGVMLSGKHVYPLGSLPPGGWVSFYEPGATSPNISFRNYG